MEPVYSLLVGKEDSVFTDPWDTDSPQYKVVTQLPKIPLVVTWESVLVLENAIAVEVIQDDSGI